MGLVRTAHGTREDRPWDSLDRGVAERGLGAAAARFQALADLRRPCSGASTSLRKLACALNYERSSGRSRMCVATFRTNTTLKVPMKPGSNKESQNETARRRPWLLICAVMLAAATAGAAGAIFTLRTSAAPVSAKLNDQERLSGNLVKLVEQAAPFASHGIGMVSIELWRPS